MTPDQIIGRLLFVDGAVRPVFTGDSGHQYVTDTDGHTRSYGTWLLHHSLDADAPLTVTVHRGDAR
jgi:hypothetical protein